MVVLLYFMYFYFLTEYGPKEEYIFITPLAKKPRTATNDDHTLAQLSASITAQVLDNLKQSGLLVLFNTSQQSQTVPNEHNLTSDPSSYVVSSEYLNEQSSRPSTSVSMQTVPLQLHRWLPVHVTFIRTYSLQLQLQRQMPVMFHYHIQQV